MSKAILTPQDETDALEWARVKVKEELRQRAIDDLRKKELAKLRAELDPDEEEVEVEIELTCKANADHITINGVEYWHGQKKKVKASLVPVINEIKNNLVRQERDISGDRWTDFYNTRRTSWKGKVL